MRAALGSRILGFTFALSAALGIAPHARANSAMIRLPEFSCSGEDDKCYQAAKAALESSAVDQDRLLDLNRPDGGRIRIGSTGRAAGETSEYSLRGKRTPIAFVVIHGLYAGPVQFDRQNRFIADLGMNSISVSLAGHGEQSGRGREVNHQDWLEETRRAVKLAHALGQKVIIMGQSTGGALAVAQALDDPQSVDGIVLLEPAIEVLPSLQLGVCVGKFFGDTPRDLPTITRMLGKDPCTDSSTSLSMGCEVTKLRNHLIKSHIEQSFVSPLEPDSRSQHEISAELGRMLRVPTLLINNPDDDIVRADSNDALLRGAARAGILAQKAEVLNEPHGTLTWAQPEVVEKALGRFLIDGFGLADILAPRIAKREELSSLRFTRALLEKIFAPGTSGEALLKGQNPEANGKKISDWLKGQFGKEIESACSGAFAARPDCKAILELSNPPKNPSEMSAVKKLSEILDFQKAEYERALNQ